MERPGGALRYAELDVTSAFTSAHEGRAHADEPLKLGATATSDNNRQLRDGTRSMARLEARMRARARRAQLSETLDQLRQQDLRERVNHRQAKRRQRRWYVLGRTLDELIEDDAALRWRILVLLDEHLVRKDERRLFALDET